MTRDFVAELAALRLTYVGSLPEKLADLAAAIAAACDGASLSRARDLAHRLRGTAGSYGVAAVGERIGAIEDRLDSVIGRDGGSSAGLSAELRSELERMLDAARTAAAEAT